VVHLQDSHIGPPAGATLFDGLRRHVENGHEGDRSAGHALSGEYLVVFRANARKREAGTPSAFVDHGGVFDGIKDAVDGILHGQHKTCGQLAQGAARIHQGGRVGDEIEGRHESEEAVSRLLDLLLSLEGGIARRNGPRNPPEQLLRCFDELVLFVFLQVTLLEYD